MRHIENKGTDEMKVVKEFTIRKFGSMGTEALTMGLYLRYSALHLVMKFQFLHGDLVTG